MVNTYMDRMIHVSSTWVGVFPLECSKHSQTSSRWRQNVYAGAPYFADFSTVYN